MLAATAGLALAGLGVVGAHPASAAAPGNDDITGATMLTPNAPVTGTTDEATSRAGELRYGGDSAIRSVWYTYRPASNQDVSFETYNIGDNVDTVISLYSGVADASGYADLTFVAGNDDGADLYSYRDVSVSSGTTYFLQVDAYTVHDPRGSFGLRINLPAPASGVPANDDLASAARVIPGINAAGDNRNATTQAGEPEQAGCVAPIRNSVWYRYTSVIARPLKFATVGATASVVNLYAGPANATADDLAPVGCTRATPATRSSA